MDSIVISVLLPVYNAERYIKESIDSILHQTYKQFEFIIINDGSTDRSEDIILSYNDNRIKYIKNDVNIGVVASLNKGLRMSVGKYIARMDADDVSVENRFEKQIAFLDQNPNIGLCGSQLKVLGEERILKYSIDNSDIKFDFLRNNSIAHPAVMFRKELLTDHQLAYEEEYCPAEDYRLWVKLSSFTDFYNFPQALLHYRLHESSISHSQRSKQYEKVCRIRASYLLQTANYWTSERENILAELFFGRAASKSELQNFVDILKRCFDNINVFDKEKMFVYMEECVFDACLNAGISKMEAFGIYYRNPFFSKYKRLLKLFLLQIKK